MTKEGVWSEFVCSHIYNELMQNVMENIDSLNLTYKIEKKQDYSNEDDKKEKVIHK